MDEKFKVGGKWFWIGVISAVLSPGIGIMYGIALLLERRYKREAIIILSVAGLMIIGLTFILGANPSAVIQ